MNSSLRQQLNNDREYAVKILEFLLKRGFLILDEHKYLISHHIRFLKTTQDGSAEAKADSQDKSSHSISGAGHNKCVDLLRIAAAYVDKNSFWGRTPLHLAAGTGDTELVDLFLKAGANVNAEDEYKQTPLHLSARNHFNKVVETLLKAGANIDAADECKQTPLHCGATCGHKGVVESLLKAGADINAENAYKQTPLHISIMHGHDSVAALLVNAGASAENIDIYGRNCIVYMDEQQNNKIMISPNNIFYNFWQSVFNIKQCFQNFEATKTKFGHAEAISATFTLTDSLWSELESIIQESETFRNNDSQSMPWEDSQPMPCGDHQTTSIDYSIPCGSSSTNCDDRPKHGSTLLTPESSHKKPAATTSSHESLYVPSPATESHKSNESVHQGLDSIRQQVENHWHKFSFELTKDWETSSSHDVKAAFQAGRIVIPTTINITQNKFIKKIKKVNHYKPGTTLHISHAGVVAPGGQIVVHQKRKATVEDDDDEDDSSSDDDSSLYI